MKLFQRSFLIFLFTAGSLFADTSIPAENETFVITSPLPRPEAMAFKPPRKIRQSLPPLKVQREVTHDCGTHSLRVICADPSLLPDLPEPVKARKNTINSVVDHHFPQTHFSVFLSVTVYDHSYSHLKWKDPYSQENFEAWCGWDFSLHHHISQVKRGDHSYSVMCFAGHINTHNHREDQADGASHPTVEKGQIRFISGDPKSTFGKPFLRTFRKYYRSNKKQLKAIKVAREHYYKSKRKWEAANPKQPQDQTVWLKPHRGSRYLQSQTGGDQ